MQVRAVDFRKTASGLCEVDDTADQPVLADQKIGEMGIAVDEAAAAPFGNCTENLGQGGAEVSVRRAGRRQAGEQRAHAVIEDGGTDERPICLAPQDGDGRAEVGGETVAFAARQPREPIVAEALVWPANVP